MSECVCGTQGGLGSQCVRGSGMCVFGGEWEFMCGCAYRTIENYTCLFVEKRSLWQPFLPLLFLPTIL